MLVATVPLAGDGQAHTGYVLALGGFVEELSAEVGLGVRGLGYYQKPRCVLVDAVNEAEARVVDVVIGSVAEVPRKGVDKRAVVVAVAGVHHQAGRLVYHQHVAVLVHDVERNVLCHDFKLVARAVHHHLNGVEWLHAVVALHRLAVDYDATCVGSLLYAVARRFLKPCHKELVDPQQLLSLVGYEAEVLVVLRSVDFYQFVVVLVFFFCHALFVYVAKFGVESRFGFGVQ